MEKEVTFLIMGKCILGNSTRESNKAMEHSFIKMAGNMRDFGKITVK